MVGDRMWNKRFTILISILLGLWCIAWLFILSPYDQETSRLQRRIQSLTQNIRSLYQEKIPPQQKMTVEIRQQNGRLARALSRLIQKIGIDDKGNLTTGVLEFRSRYGKMARRLKQIANKKGIAFDESMGFSSSLPGTVDKRYWISLKLGYHVALYLLQLTMQGNHIRSISKIHYPNLANSSTQKKYFTEDFSLEITIRSSYYLLMKVIHSFSRPGGLEQKRCPFPYLAIADLKILQTKENDIVLSTIRLVAVDIHLGAEIKTKRVNSPVQVPPNTVPIWERY